VALSAGAGALALCAGAASADGAKAASVTRCSTSGLVVWLDTQGNGAAGSSYYELEMTNLSGQTCSLGGFPGVSAVGLSGKQLGSAARREGSAGKTVTLTSGATAVATLRIVIAGNFPASKCGIATAAGVKVYPPGQKAAKTVPFPFEACSKSGPVYLAVGPVHKS
jgi:hypothetical protein